MRASRGEQSSKYSSHFGILIDGELQSSSGGTLKHPRSYCTEFVFGPISENFKGGSEKPALADSLR
jgi:hypothetical protein